jgi:hypothetical protein
MTEKMRSISIPSRKLAKWLDGQPGSWWNVDGDPLLTSEVDFPCPNEELAEALRKHDNDIILFAGNNVKIGVRTDWDSLEIDDLTDTENRRKEKTLLAAWKGSDIEWLLSEDKEMAEIERHATTESTDAPAPN